MRAGVDITKRNKVFGIENNGKHKRLRGTVHADVLHATSLNNTLNLSHTAKESGDKQNHIKTSRSSSVSPEARDESLGEGQQTSHDVRLSVRQLLVRRGLAVLSMLIILAAGVFISELLIRLLQLDE